jgi:hypothetical protein
LKSTAGREWKWNPTFLRSLPKPERATPFTDPKGIQFQVNEIAAPAAGVEKHVEDCIGSNVLAQFDFTQQAAHKREVQKIKQLAQNFGDEQFQARVQRLMDAEQQTLAKRFGTVAAVSG